MKKTKTKLNRTTERQGLALVVVLVILVVLSSIVYSLSAKIATAQHRRQYFVDYQNAQYAASSAIKYALANLNKIKPKLIERKDAPDFSDLFTLDKFEYQEMLEEWADIQTEKMMLEQEENEDSRKQQDYMLDIFASLLDPSLNDPNLSDEEILQLAEEGLMLIDPNALEIPGPYGHPWPQVTEPVEFYINDTKITIHYEDENAKMPLTWAITTDKKINKQSQAALETFAEWMQMDAVQIEELAFQLEDIAEIKQFKINPKDIVKTTTKTVKTPVKSSRRTRRTSRRTTSRKRTTKETVRTAIGHTTDFAKLLHSSMLNLEDLSIPLPNTGKRYEAPIKYLALWGSQRVNINSAPRHVLEAAFTFGGDAEEIANEIIILRQEKPFKDIDDLKSRLYGYNDSIQKTKNFITTTSKYFSIKITASTGRAKAAVVATVLKNGNNFQRIAIITQ